MFASRSTLSRANSPPNLHHRPAWTVRLALGVTGVLGLSACGASIHALYEGDVRFEHCMALDDNQEVKPTIRTACWDEWLKFYTFGQTSDRIEYAKSRMRQLRGGDDQRAPEMLASNSRPTEAVPEPTTALAPPPMMLVVDAGAAETEKEPDDSTKPPGAECASRCETSWLKCKKECVTPMCNRPTCISKCEKTCKEEHATCMRYCFM
jgi:hypothetical protein